MLGNLLDPIERACDAARTPREKGAKKRQINGIIPDLIIDVRHAILNQLISCTTPTWFGQVEAICDARTLSPHHGTSLRGLRRRVAFSAVVAAGVGEAARFFFAGGD